MRISAQSLFLCWCVPLVLAGCVSQQQIQFETMVPAKVSFPHKARVSVRSVASGTTAHALKKGFSQAMQRAGVGLQTTSSGPSVHLVIDESSIRLNEVGEYREPLHMSKKQLNILHERRMQRTYKGSTHAELRARVSLVYGTEVLWQRNHTVTDTIPPYTRPDLQALCGRFVAEILPDILPQRETYTVQVNVKNASAELRQAVQACRNKDWESALNLARQAHKLHPQAPEPIYLIGMLARHYGDYPAATALFKKAYALRPDARYLKAQQQNLELYRAEFEARQFSGR